MLATRQDLKTEVEMWREAMQIISGKNDLVELFCPMALIFVEFDTCKIPYYPRLSGLTARWYFKWNRVCMYSQSVENVLQIMPCKEITSLRDLALYAFLKDMHIHLCNSHEHFAVYEK
jgi:hypothetical protein